MTPNDYADLLRAKLKEALRQRDALLEAAKAMASQLEAIQENESHKAAWSLAYVHGHVYTGPDWSGQLDGLRTAIALCEKGEK